MAARWIDGLGVMCFVFHMLCWVAHLLTGYHANLPDDRARSRACPSYECVPLPPDIRFRSVEKRCEDGPQGNTSAVHDRPVNCISRDKHEITGFDSPCLITDSKATLTFQNQNDFVVIWLDVNDVRTVFESVDVTR